ncbi:MAG: Tc toxin subunit A, partial [Polyangiaceae bacterium]
MQGLVSSPGRGGLAGLRVEIVDRNAGPDVPLTSAITDEQGRYVATFGAPHNKTRPDLCARAYSGHDLLGSSAVRYNAGARETLDVVVPARSRGLPSEYEVLSSALTAHHPGKPAELQESDDREDITYLARKTGWDARAIAWMAIADQLAHHGAAKGGGKALEPAFYYALFRAGLPTDPDRLYEVTSVVAGEIWREAIVQGVISETLERGVDAAVKTFETLSAAHMLDAKPASGSSTLRELLHLQLGGDTQRMLTFAELYASYQHDLPAFWEHVEKAFGADLTKRLKLDGQLGHLTLNNAPLIGALRKAVKLAAAKDLVEHGFYQAQAWVPLIGSAIPKEIEGDKLEHRRAAYAEYIAAQVRLAYPTEVVAAMIESGALPLPPGPDVKDGLRSFFTAHSSAFDFGAEPIERYLTKHQLTGKVALPVVATIKQLQRVYQITPTNRAMQALLEHNIDSAYAVTRYDEAGFARAFGEVVGGENIARQVHAKARLVHGAALNLATSHLTARGAPRLGAKGGTFSMSAAPVKREVTLDQLFGSMDFCACADCRSILSPAAYLVDLLQFVDYPHAGSRNPQTVLLERRPDLQHLPLTCENTNTALPYIDLVNETLEYFVAHRMSLAHFEGHTTDPEVTSEELMASPQFVSNTAYAALKGALFPPPLPFDRSLERLRLHFGALGLSLPDAMETLQAKGSAYRGRDILMERIGLSRAEYRVLTDGSLTLHELFGIAERQPTRGSPASEEGPGAEASHLQMPGGSEDAAIAELSSFEGFCRRARVSYEELYAIVRTRFINPDSGILSRLEPLSLSFATIRALKQGDIADSDMETLLPTGLDPAAYGAPAGAPRRDLRPVVAWLKDDATYARIMKLVAIAAPDDESDPCSATSLRLRYGDPDPSHNALRRIEFVRLNRFIRLWRKLGLTIEQTDAIVAALYPAASELTGVDEAADLERLDEGFATLIARLGFLFQVIQLLSLTPQRDLPSLLACWAPIGTAGKRSLYRTMFLNPSVLHRDRAFAEGPDGRVLQDSAQLLWQHEHALRSAMNLTGSELALIAGALVPDDAGVGSTVISGALGFDATTPLTLDNVSAIHRRGWLARTLRLSVVELLRLIDVTGLDPFAPLDPAVEAPVVPPAIRFIRLVQALRAASLKPVQALYLVWNEDLSGKSAPADTRITALARTLRTDFAAVETQFAMVPDPNGDIAKGLMTLVYGDDATNVFFGLLDGTLTVSVRYAHPDPTLPPPLLLAGNGRLTYDDFRKQLSFGGVLDDGTTLPALNAAAAGVAPLLAAIAALSTASHRQVDPFFAAHR